MDQRSPAYEATLLYRSAQALDLEALQLDIEDVLEDHGEELVSFEQIDSVFYLIMGEEIKILLALGNEGLPLDGFLEVGRPSASTMQDNEILRRLTQISSSATVIALPQDPNALEIGRKLDRVLHDTCWDIVECLHDSSTSDLVFWGASETLYAAEEFERACTYSAHQDMVVSTPDFALPDTPMPKTEVLNETAPNSARAQDWLRAEEEQSRFGWTNILPFSMRPRRPAAAGANLFR